MTLDFRCAWTAANDTRSALEEVRGQIAQPAPACVFFYCSPEHDLDELARGIGELYDCPVLACTTAGEVVCGHGYVEGGLAAASLSSPQMRVVQAAIPDVRCLNHGVALQMVTQLIQELGIPSGPDEKCFGLLLIDGLCGREEFVAAALYGALGGIPLIGGSAGTSGSRTETHVFANGRFRAQAAVLTLIRTSLPYVIFKTDHFERSDTRFVVTRAEPDRRRLLEINGISPADYYFEQTGITRDGFSPIHAVRHPLLLPVGSDHYARGVLNTEPDGSLQLSCAIEEGIVMRLGRSLDIVAETRRQQRAIEVAVPNHQVTLGFDCLCRRLEVLDRGLLAPMRRIVDDMKLFGFNTYGEQFNGLHVNQTLTGVALGAQA
jgi:hypothetical protein